MNFADINSQVDDVINFFTGWANQKQNYEARLAAKDKQIGDLTNQLQTATSSLQADDTEIGTFHDKLASLSALIKGQPADAASSTPTDASTPAASSTPTDASNPATSSPTDASNSNPSQQVPVAAAS